MNRVNNYNRSDLPSQDKICGPIREGRNALLPRSWGDYFESWGHCVDQIIHKQNPIPALVSENKKQYNRERSLLDSQDKICGPTREARNALLPRLWGDYCGSWGHCIYANWVQFWYKKSFAHPQFQMTQSPVDIPTPIQEKRSNDLQQ